MTDSTEKSGDASRKRFSNVIWSILVILGLAWWFYPQIRILVKPESLSDVSQEAAEETQLPAAVGEVPATVDSVDAKITDAPEMVEAQEVAVASLPTEGAPTILPLKQNQNEISKETDTPLAAVQPKMNPVAAPKFDLVRIDEDGSAVIAGLADGMGFVVLSVDGVELSEARANLNGGGQFVIFALLPSTHVPQALRLHLYTEDGSSVIVSTETIFVAAAPKIEEQDVVVAGGTDGAARA